MRSIVVCVLVLSFTSSVLPLSAQGPSDARFRTIPDAKNIGEYMRRLSARPHHVGW